MTIDKCKFRKPVIAGRPGALPHDEDRTTAGPCGGSAARPGSTACWSAEAEIGAMLVTRVSARLDPSERRRSRTARRSATGSRIGPFCHVGPEVVLGGGLRARQPCGGRRAAPRSAPRTRIFPFASIGHQPQDLKYRGEASTLTIGSDCLIREGVTMNPGTSGGGLETVGRRPLHLPRQRACRPRLPWSAMTSIFSNNVMLAGHCASATSRSSAAAPR